MFHIPLIPFNKSSKSKKQLGVLIIFFLLVIVISIVFCKHKDVNTTQGGAFCNASVVSIHEEEKELIIRIFDEDVLENCSINCSDLFVFYYDKEHNEIIEISWKELIAGDQLVISVAEQEWQDMKIGVQKIYVLQQIQLISERMH